MNVWRHCLFFTFFFKFIQRSGSSNSLQYSFVRSFKYSSVIIISSSSSSSSSSSKRKSENEEDEQQPEPEEERIMGISRVTDENSSNNQNTNDKGLVVADEHTLTFSSASSWSFCRVATLFDSVSNCVVGRRQREKKENIVEERRVRKFLLECKRTK